MSKALRGLAGLAAFAGGFAEGVNRDTERKARMKAQEEEAAFNKTQRDRTVRMQAADDAYQEQLKQAAKPVDVQPGEVYQPEVDDEGNAMPANPTAGTFKAGTARFPTREAAQQAAEQANTPAARGQRIVATMQANGRFQEAAQTEAAQRQSKLADLQLGEAEAQAVARSYDRDLIKAVQSGGHQGLVQFIDDTQGDGAGGKVKGIVKPSADGKTVQYALKSADGTERLLPYTFTNDEQGAQHAAFMLSRGVSITEKVNHVRALAKDAEDRADKDRNYDLRKKEVEDRGLVRAAQAEAAGARAEATRARMGSTASGQGQGQGGPVWDDKADAFLRQRYTVTDPVSGEVRVDGAGLQFAKAVALAQARRNGGDTTSGLGYAFQIDNQIRARVGNDPAKIDKERQILLQKLLTPPAAEVDAAPAPTTTKPPAARMATAAPAAPAAQAAPATRPAPAPQGDQVLARLERDKQQRVAVAQQALDEASAQLRAAGQSGDPQAMAFYSEQVRKASAALDAARR